MALSCVQIKSIQSQGLIASEMKNIIRPKIQGSFRILEKFNELLTLISAKVKQIKAELKAKCCMSEVWKNAAGVLEQKFGALEVKLS